MHVLLDAVADACRGGHHGIAGKMGIARRRGDKQGEAASPEPAGRDAELPR